MGATMKTAISPLRQPKTEPNANSIHFLDEDLALVPASGIPEEFHKLSRFLPVIVLVPKSAVHDKTTQKRSGLDKSVTGLIDTSDVCLPLDAAKAWLRSPNATLSGQGKSGHAWSLQNRPYGMARDVVLIYPAFS